MNNQRSRAYCDLTPRCSITASWTNTNNPGIDCERKSTFRLYVGGTCYLFQRNGSLVDVGGMAVTDSEYIPQISRPYI